MAESHNNTEKKSSKKLIIIIAAAVLIIGGGVGAYLFLKKPPEAGHGEEAEAQKHAEAEHKSAEHEEKAEPDVFYALPTPLIVDFPSGSGAKVIKISITIQVAGEETVAALKKNDPMLRNNLLMAISAAGAENAKTTEGKLALQAAMLSETGKVLEKMAGKNTAKNVYFTDFVMQ